MQLVFASLIAPCHDIESTENTANLIIAGALRRAGVNVTFIGFKPQKANLAEPDNTICLGDLELNGNMASTRKNLRYLASALWFKKSGLTASLPSIAGYICQHANLAIDKADEIFISGPEITLILKNELTTKPYIYVSHNNSSTHVAQKKIDTLSENAKCVLHTHNEKTVVSRFKTGHDFFLPLIVPAPSDFKESRAKAFDVGLVGTWTSEHERAGLEWMLQQVLPCLPESLSLAIAGELPKDFPQRQKRALFLGKVLNQIDFMRQCRVIALPVGSDRGQNLKSKSVFQLGLPAVATSLAVEGITPLPENVIVAKKVKDFARTLSSHVLDVRTNIVRDMDGSIFHKTQISIIDKVIKDGLSSLKTRSKIIICDDEN